MPSYEIHLQPERSPVQVFDALADLEQGHLWATMHNDWTLRPPASLSVGDAAHHTVTVWGVPLEIRWTVVRHERPRVLELRGTGRLGIEVRITATLKPGRPGTLLTILTEIDGGLMAGLEGEAFARIVKQCQEESLRLLALPAV